MGHLEHQRVHVIFESASEAPHSPHSSPLPAQYLIYQREITDNIALDQGTLSMAKEKSNGHVESNALITYHIIPKLLT